jgi:hypothetical protein
MAERNVRQVEESAIYTPPNIQPNVPIVLCWDNNDINEETVRGHGTTHCTNGMIIQRKVNPNPPTASIPNPQPYTGK